MDPFSSTITRDAFDKIALKTTAHKYMLSKKVSWSLLTDFTKTNKLVILLFHHCALLTDIYPIKELPDVLLSHSGGLLDQCS